MAKWDEGLTPAQRRRALLLTREQRDLLEVLQRAGKPLSIDELDAATRYYLTQDAVRASMARMANRGLAEKLPPPLRGVKLIRYKLTTKGKAALR